MTIDANGLRIQVGLRVPITSSSHDDSGARRRYFPSFFGFEFNDIEVKENVRDIVRVFKVEENNFLFLFFNFFMV